MTTPAFCFGSYSLDSAKRKLLRDGERVSLPARAFDWLAHLAAHRDRAVEVEFPRSDSAPRSPTAK